MYKRVTLHDDLEAVVLSRYVYIADRYLCVGENPLSLYQSFDVGERFPNCHPTIGSVWG